MQDPCTALTLVLQVVILGDTCNSSALVKAAQNADMVSHEATFAGGMEEKALVAQHSTAYMAGEFARKINAKKLVLTHFSARYQRAQGSEKCENVMGALLDEAKQGFQNDSVEAARDFFTYDVPENQSNSTLLEDEDCSEEGLLQGANG